MKNKGVFKRVEMKYILNEFQYRALRKDLEGLAEVDQYGETPILNIYYDTPDFHLVRMSLDKPLYKEKLRLRSYGTPDDNRNSFIEIKKKFQGVVYKRRVAMPYTDAVSYLEGDDRDAIRARQIWTPVDRQISREIDSFMGHYQTLAPRMVVSYDRIAMFGVNDPELRITFDKNLRWRTDDLDLRHGGYGTALLLPDQYLMEIKIMGAMPVQLARSLSSLKIFSSSFSKYGSGYRTWFFQQSAQLAAKMLLRQVQTDYANAG